MIAMTVWKGLLAVLFSTMMGGVLGGLVGYAIGSFVPSAYRTMFAPVPPDFSATAVGVGLGVPQGMMLGAVVGIAVVAISVWREVRMAENAQRARWTDETSH